MREDGEHPDTIRISSRVEHKDCEVLRHEVQNEAVHEVSRVRTSYIRMQESTKMRILRAKSSLRAVFSSREYFSVDMRSLQTQML